MKIYTGMQAVRHGVPKKAIVYAMFCLDHVTPHGAQAKVPRAEIA